MHLILNAYGTQLSVQDGIFVVRYPEGVQHLAPTKIKSITIRKGIRLSSNALYLAIENQIELILIDKSGKPFGRLWSNQYGSISTIRRNQVDWAASNAGTEWVIQSIIQKIENQTALLMGISTSTTNKRAIDKGLNQLENAIEKLKAIQPEPISALAGKIRGIEGSAGKIYWASLSQALPQAYQFSERSQHPALDSFNCLLNYAYGILYSIVEGALIKAGIDPYIGVLHRDEYNRPTLVYDCIEIYRIWADYVVTDLCMQQAIGHDSFLIEKGAWWLESYGKRILVQSMHDFLDELTTMNRLSRSRRTHIDLDAQRLARTILNFKPNPAASGNETDTNTTNNSASEHTTPPTEGSIPF